MNLLTEQTSMLLWHETIKDAEQRCSIVLPDDIEVYLISLLIRYTNKPELTKQILATLFLHAISLRANERNVSLQRVGDECLLFAGLFPHLAAKKQVKISYFVDLGRGAYGAISNTTNDLYRSLSLQFVALMDVLQAIPAKPILLPLEAYEQWNEVGSKRALQILNYYTKGVPTEYDPRGRGRG